MPITPLHFGLMAPINHLARGRVSNLSFVIANIWIDGPYILGTLFNLEYMKNHENHTMVNALLVALILSVFRWRDLGWWLGAFIGTVSHLLLDSLVHTDVLLFDWIDANPFYMGWMEPVSYVMMPLTFWWTLQCVASFRATWLRE